MKKVFRKTCPLFLLVFCLLFSAGCSKSEETPDVTTLKLNKDGTLTQTIVGEPDEGMTDAGLKDYIAEQITDYGGGREEPGVELKDVNENENGVRVVLNYSSLEDYAAFNRVDAFAGTVAEAYRSGYTFLKDFVTDSGVKISGYMIPTEYPDLSVVVFREPMKVIFPEKAIAVSEDITLNEDGSCMISKSVTEAIPEIFQSVNSTCSYILFKTNESEKK